MDKTTRFFKTSENEAKWHLLDADGKTLGRIASEAARLLRGKHKPVFTPNSDMGDFVVVVNASKVKVTGKRAELKEYFHYTGYPGGATFEKFPINFVVANAQDRFMEKLKGVADPEKAQRLEQPRAPVAADVLEGA